MATAQSRDTHSLEIRVLDSSVAYDCQCEIHVRLRFQIFGVNTQWFQKRIHVTNMKIILRVEIFA